VAIDRAVGLKVADAGVEECDAGELEVIGASGGREQHDPKRKQAGQFVRRGELHFAKHVYLQKDSYDKGFIPLLSDVRPGRSVPCLVGLSKWALVPAACLPQTLLHNAQQLLPLGRSERGGRFGEPGGLGLEKSHGLVGLAAAEPDDGEGRVSGAAEGRVGGDRLFEQGGGTGFTGRLGFEQDVRSGGLAERRVGPPRVAGAFKPAEFIQRRGWLAKEEYRVFAGQYEKPVIRPRENHAGKAISARDAACEQDGVGVRI